MLCNHLFLKGLLLIVLLCFSGSCKNVQENDSDSLARMEQYEEIIEVSAVPAGKDNFYHELVSNGRLKAINKATVPFRVSEMVNEVHVINGQRVSKGDLLVVLEDFPFQLRMKRAVDQLERARINRDDNLTLWSSSRYIAGDSLSVPANVWNSACISSGYTSALNEIAEARYQLEHTRIKAPISGTISEFEVRPYNPGSSFDKVCVIVDNSSLEARFPVLESETSMIEIGQPVEIIPFAGGGKSYTGRVTGFEPTVNEQGMIMVNALVNNPGGGLLDGMNIRIFLKKEIPDQLIIPREALVLRQGRKVVFTYENGKALWNYVETGYENSRHFSITEGLVEEQMVIVTGNFNLAHETPVRLIDF